MQKYYTSYYQPASIFLSFIGNKLRFDNIILPPNCNSILVNICSYASGRQVIEDTIIKFPVSGKSMLLSILYDGIYFLQIYFENGENNVYNGIMFRRDIPFCFRNNKFSFIKTVVQDSNELFVKSLGTPNNSTLLSKLVLELGLYITKKEKYDYEKLLKIHDWVASYLYYDKDALSDGSYIEADYSAEALLQSRKCVCQGYANLCSDLLNSIGLKTVNILCFALGVSTTGGWELEENLNADPNHVLTMTFLNNRWVIMDVTWDSDNEYINGKFQKKTGVGVSHKYFDNTLEFISNTHRFVL